MIYQSGEKMFLLQSVPLLLLDNVLGTHKQTHTHTHTQVQARTIPVQSRFLHKEPLLLAVILHVSLQALVHARNRADI